MYRRSDVRHACFRAKKGVASASQKVILQEVEKLLSPGQCWDNFSKIWDVLVDRSGSLVIVKPETDYDFIHSTCLEASICYKNNIKFDTTDPRKQNVILTVESIMLDGLMNWSNYNSVWGVEVDPELKNIKTKLSNVPVNQVAVTEDMIKSSMKEADGSAFQEKKEDVTLEMKPMSEEQKKAFQEFLSRKNSTQVKE